MDSLEYLLNLASKIQIRVTEVEVCIMQDSHLRKYKYQVTPKSIRRAVEVTLRRHEKDICGDLDCTDCKFGSIHRENNRCQDNVILARDFLKIAVGDDFYELVSNIEKRSRIIKEREIVQNNIEQLTKKLDKEDGS
jgi:hypothetical protein